MSLVRVTSPTIEPISLAEAKAHSRVTVTTDDALIAIMIAAARQFAETKTQRQIIASRWKLVLDAFPGPSLFGVPFGKEFSLPRHAVVMPIAPVLQVVSIKYLDMAGVQQTMPSSDYTVDLTEPVRITPQFGKIWPVVLPQIGAVEIVFDAGYAAPLTANAGADTISVPGWQTLAVNNTLRVVNRDRIAIGDGALPSPLAAYTDYYVRSVAGADLYTLAASAGGALLDITGAGTGDSFIGEIPSGLKAWMLLRIGTMYENREAVVIAERHTMEVMPDPFVDGLLDPYRMVIY